tara:strand:+ start:89 stop:667 length:579 start_codon:yes stop_codon:yes gene_type:complete
MTNQFETDIYQKILRGEQVVSFEKFLVGIEPRHDYTQKSYLKIKYWLKRDFENGNLPTKARKPIKKWLMWLWENGKVKIPSSTCRPYMRMVGNYICYHDGRIKNRKTQETVSNFYLNEEGYAVYSGKLVHRLMAKAWLKNPDPNEYTEVNHKDKNRSNNNIENLEWVSHENNILHRDGKEYESAPRYYTEGV